MKKTLLILAVICYSFNIQAQNSDTTTYYFIRHAEKIRTDKTNKNPNLTEKGLNRAKNWSTVFTNVNFDYIYSTKYNRTIQTATPTAKSKGLEIQQYNPSYLNNDDFKSKTKGKTVLIVGHSNTTPAFVNAILGEEKYSEIEDNNNSNLYIVTISNKKKSSILLKIPF